MNILVSNDDGVFAAGLLCLAEKLKTIAHVNVIAPNRDRSGASHCLTLDRPLYPEKHSNGFISVNGTPTDCVHLGVRDVFPEQHDIVVSGINSGPNLGDDVLYSGTVAAAIEGRFLGMPAIAVSMAGRNEQYYETAAEVVLRLIQSPHEVDLPLRTILNVNVPAVPYSEIKGIQVTRLGHREPADNPIKSEDPRKKVGYWLAAVGAVDDAGEGTDFHAVENGYVSVTPLQVDMTRYEVFDQVKQWVSNSSGIKHVD